MLKVGLIEQENLAEMLAENGYEIAFSCNGIDARKHIEDTDVDVVITDLVMTGEDGFALIEKYKNKKFIVASNLKSEVFKVGS